MACGAQHAAYAAGDVRVDSASVSNARVSDDSVRSARVSDVSAGSERVCNVSVSDESVADVDIVGLSRACGGGVRDGAATVKRVRGDKKSHSVIDSDNSGATELHENGECVSKGKHDAAAESVSNSDDAVTKVREAGAEDVLMIVAAAPSDNKKAVAPGRNKNGSGVSTRVSDCDTLNERNDDAAKMQARGREARRRSSVMTASSVMCGTDEVIQT